MSESERGTGRTQRSIERCLVHMLTNPRAEVLFVTCTLPAARDAVDYMVEWCDRNGVKCDRNGLHFHIGHSHMRATSMDQNMRGLRHDLVVWDHHAEERAAVNKVEKEDKETILRLMRKHGYWRVEAAGGEPIWNK